MSDQARLNHPPSAEIVSHEGPGSADPEKTHTLLAWTQQTGREALGREPSAERDRSGALVLLQQAAEAIRASADQSEKMEARARALMARATEEVQRAQARIEELEARLQASEARATAAEARANAAEVRANQTEAQVKETEEWFRRAREAIMTELSAGMRLLDRSEVRSAEPNRGGMAA